MSNTTEIRVYAECREDGEFLNLTSIDSKAIINEGEYIEHGTQILNYVLGGEECQLFYLEVTPIKISHTYTLNVEF